MVAELSQLRLLPFRLTLRRRRGDRRRPDAGRVRQHQKLRRRHADLSRRRPRRRPARHHDGALDSRTKLIRLFPTVFKGTHVDLDRRDHRRAPIGSRVDSPGINAYADGELRVPTAGRRVGGARRAKILRPALQRERRKSPHAAKFAHFASVRAENYFFPTPRLHVVGTRLRGCRPDAAAEPAHLAPLSPPSR